MSKQKDQAGSSDTGAPSVATAGKYTPRKCREMTGTSKAAHAAASALHGWHDHMHHANGPFQMTLDVYREAVKAAGASSRKLTPHGAALSPYARFRGAN